MDEDTQKKLEAAIEALEPGECIGHWSSDDESCRTICLISQRCRNMTESAIQSNESTQPVMPLDHLVMRLSADMRFRPRQSDAMFLYDFFNDDDTLRLRLLVSKTTQAIQMRCNGHKLEFQSLVGVKEADDVYDEIQKVLVLESETPNEDE